MKNLRLILVLMATLGASNAVSAGADLGAGSLWEIIDVNKDGLISKGEAAYSKEASAQWNLLDLNKDGVLSEKEFSLIDLSAS